MRSPRKTQHKTLDCSKQHTYQINGREAARASECGLNQPAARKTKGEHVFGRKKIPKGTVGDINQKGTRSTKGSEKQEPKAGPMKQ